jgi:hypothetical protein
MSIYRFFSNLSIPLLLFFCPNISVKAAVNSICLRTCISFCFPPWFVSQSGCKSRKLISNWQMFLEVFLRKFSFPFFLLIYQSVNELSDVLRGANVTSVFKSHKLFLNYFFKTFVSLNSSACQYFRERLSLLRVQKYTLYLHLQGFLLYISHLF